MSIIAKMQAAKKKLDLKLRCILKITQHQWNIILKVQIKSFHYLILRDGACSVSPLGVASLDAFYRAKLLFLQLNCKYQIMVLHQSFSLQLYEERWNTKLVNLLTISPAR